MYQMQFEDDSIPLDEQMFDEYGNDGNLEEFDDQPPVLDAHPSVSYENDFGYFEQNKTKRIDIYDEKYVDIPYYDPEEAEQEIPEAAGMPYCDICNKVIKSWSSYEYHMLKNHINYKPFRCLICGKDQEFYTEDEGRFHMKMVHADVKDTPLIKIFNAEKDRQMLSLFENVMRMREEGDGLNVLVEEMKGVENHTSFQRNLKMKVSLPADVLKDTLLRDVGVQAKLMSREEQLSRQNIRQYPSLRPNISHRNVYERKPPITHANVYEEKSPVIHQNHILLYPTRTADDVLVYTEKTETNEKKMDVVFDAPGPSDRHYCEEELDDNLLS